MPTREPPKPAPGVTAPAPPLPAWSPPSTGAGAVLAGGPAAVLALQRTCGNRAVSELLQRATPGRRPVPASAAGASHGTLQRVRQVELRDQDAMAGFSQPAMRYRQEHQISPHLNVATFNFIKRPPLEEAGGPRQTVETVTMASTGVADPDSNASHSEAQIIQHLNLLGSDGAWFPRQVVIDWIYTDRRACYHVPRGGGRATGCLPDIMALEEMQRWRAWDGVRHGEYGTRDDLEITVFSSVCQDETAVRKIKRSNDFAPIRREAVASLAQALDELGEHGAHERADQALGMWDDYDLPGRGAKRKYEEILEDTEEAVLFMARLRRDARSHVYYDPDRVPDWADYLDDPESYQYAPHEYKEDVLAVTGLEAAVPY